MPSHARPASAQLHIIAEPPSPVRRDRRLLLLAVLLSIAVWLAVGSVITALVVR